MGLIHETPLQAPTTPEILRWSQKEKNSMISNNDCLLFTAHKNSKSTKVHNCSGNVHVHVFASTIEGLVEVEVVKAGNFPLFVIFDGTRARDKALKRLDGVRLCVDTGLIYLKASKPDLGSNITRGRNSFRSSGTNDALLVMLQKWFRNRRAVTVNSIRHYRCSETSGWMLSAEDKSSPLWLKALTMSNKYPGGKPLPAEPAADCKLCQKAKAKRKKSGYRKALREDKCRDPSNGPSGILGVAGVAAEAEPRDVDLGMQSRGVSVELGDLYHEAVQNLDSDE